jgi:hypothetical protein
MEVTGEQTAEVVDTQESGEVQLPIDGEQQEVQEEVEKSLYEEIEAITGFTLEKQYSDDVQGYAQRELDVYEKGFQDAYGDLKNTHPDIYELLEYKQNGGNPLDLLAKKLSANKREVNDTYDAKQVVSSYLESVGMSPKRIEKMIESLEDEGELEEEAKKYVELLDKQKDDEYNKELERQQLQYQQLQQDAKNVQLSIEDKINKGDIGNFIPSREDREAFKEYLFGNQLIRQSADGKYFIFRELDVKNIDSDLMAEFLKFKKGDLKTIIQKQAKTEVVKRLQRNIKNNTETNKEGSIDDPFRKKFGF